MTLFSSECLLKKEKEIQDLKKELELQNHWVAVYSKKEKAQHLIVNRIFGMLQSKPAGWQDNIWKFFEASKRIHSALTQEDWENALNYLDPPLKLSD